MEYNFDLFKCRCSAIHTFMAESRSNPSLTEIQATRLTELENKDKLTIKQEMEMCELLIKKENGTKIFLSDTAIAYLMEEYAWQTQKMVRINKELEISQMEKGKIVEPESVNLLCITDGVLYNYNHEKIRVYNDYLSGEVDAYLGDSIMSATTIPDVKSIWDYPTFLCKKNEPISKANDWQVKGYMKITGAQHGFVADCLIDTPEYVINKLKWQLFNKVEAATEFSPEFVERWEVIQHSMKFDHIPPRMRVNKKKVEPMTDEQEAKLYDRVKYARDYLWKFHEEYISLPPIQ